MRFLNLRIDYGTLDVQSLTPLVNAVIKGTSEASVYLRLGHKCINPLRDISIPLGVTIFLFGERKLAFSMELESIIADDFFSRFSFSIVYKFRE